MELCAELCHARAIEEGCRRPTDCVADDPLARSLLREGLTGAMLAGACLSNPKWSLGRPTAVHLGNNLLYLVAEGVEHLPL